MRCTDCKARDATVVWVQGTGIYTDVRREGDPELEESEEPSLPAIDSGSDASQGGPNLCEPCAQRRYEANLPAGAPSWEEFTHGPD